VNDNFTNGYPRRSEDLQVSHSPSAFLIFLFQGLARDTKRYHCRFVGSHVVCQQRGHL
jgi:hypothetical protein